MLRAVFLRSPRPRASVHQEDRWEGLVRPPLVPRILVVRQREIAYEVEPVARLDDDGIHRRQLGVLELVFAVEEERRLPCIAGYVGVAVVTVVAGGAVAVRIRHEPS